jgi:Flp pilus assembly protein TadG
MLALRRRSRAVCQGRTRSRPLNKVASCPSGYGERFGEHGMVTAEFAVVLPAVVLVLALSLGALGLALDQIRCVDAARAGARAASRGDSDGAVILVTRRAAPAEALVSMARSGDLVRVSVVSRPRVAGSLLPSWLRASSAASAAREPSGPQ